MSDLVDFSYLQSRANPTLFLEERRAYDGSGNLEYLAYARKPNASTSASIWFITKYTYDGSNRQTRQQMPDDGPKFAYDWDNKANHFS